MLAEIAGRFSIHGEFINAVPFGKGHINDTFKSCWNQAGTITHYTHQRINHNIFNHPDKVMDNILRVTKHIAEKNRKALFAGWSRRSLIVVPSLEGKPWTRDNKGNWWRTYLFIENSHTKDTASSADEAFLLGGAVGLFQEQLSDLPPPRLHDTIKNFHDMEKRYLQFYDALKKNAPGRAETAAAEINFMKDNEKRGRVIICALKEKKIPERICHNDTKMNNILLDNDDLSALCMIDLDTVMPGSSLYDLGDLIRTAANTSAEDEQDTEKTAFAINLYKNLLEGYLLHAKNFLVTREKELLAESGRYMTQIMGLRFLTDYLNGDKYYRTSRADHNLDRCRTQIALINSMDNKWDEIQDVTRKLLCYGN